jgi:quinol monooxygenase YgiN
VVFSVLKLFPSAKQRTHVVEILRSVRDLTRPMTGCVGCWIFEEDFLHNHVRYAEQWETEEALKVHIRSDLYRRVLAAMELSKQPPEVNFYYATLRRGFEVIEAARGEATTLDRR